MTPMHWRVRAGPRGGLGIDPVLVVKGDSQAKGTADDQAAFVAAYVADPKVQILNAAGAFVQYTPGTAGGSGLAYGSNDTGVGPEIGFIAKFRAAYPASTLYIIKEGNPGAFQARGPAIGGAFNISSVGGNAYTVNSGALSGSNTLVVGAGIETGVYIPFSNFLSVAGLNGGRSGPAFGPSAVTQYNATLSWSPTEGLCYSGNSGNINNAARARLVSALATLVSGGKNPQIIATMLVLGTNDKTDTGSTATFQTDTTAFINQYRAGWSISGVPTTMARVTNSGSGGLTVRAAQLAIKGAMTKVGLVDMDAQPISADSVHWRIAGLQAMGGAAFDFTYGNANALLL